MLSKEESMSKAPFSTETFHASAGMVIDTDNLVYDPNDIIQSNGEKSNAGAISTSNASWQTNRYNKLKARTRSRRPNNSTQHAKIICNTNDVNGEGANGAGNSNSPLNHVSDIDTNEIEAEVREASNPEMELDKENVENLVYAKTNVPDVSTYHIAEKIGIGRKITTRDDEGDYDNFVNQLKRELSSDHKEVGLRMKKRICSHFSAKQHELTFYFHLVVE